jgi:hypothetical protein
LREAASRCLYGVDVNDLAAELAKVSLWLEALEPGKPLSFLDARIRVGNSLLGTTPKLLRAGIRDVAFKELEGDDKQYAAKVRRRNHAESSGQGAFGFGDRLDASNSQLATERAAVLSLTDDVDQVRVQAKQWAAYEQSPEYLARKLQADTWCASFVWPLHSGTPEPPTNGVFGAIGNNPFDPTLTETIEEAERIADDYRFFHWHLEFPEIFQVSSGRRGSSGPEGWVGGFSCLLGNPPWEHIELKEQEFFSVLAPDIAAASGAQRKKLIASLPESDPVASRLYIAAKRHIDGIRAYISDSERYPLSGRGRVNTYAVFAEIFRDLIGARGRAGIIVPTGIATDATTQHFFKDLVSKHSLAALYDFENAAPIFPSVHRSYKFCLLTMTGREERENAVSFAFFLHNPEDIAVSQFPLTTEEITLLNPNTGTCPVFRTRRDAEITVGIYRHIPVLVREGDPNGNPWGIKFRQGLFNMTSDSGLFYTSEQLEADGWMLRGNVFERDAQRMLPLYQGMMITFYDHRAADVIHSPTATKRQNQPRYLTERDHQDPYRVAIPIYWVAEMELSDEVPSWLPGFSDVTSPTNERTMVPAAMPRVAVGNTISLILSTRPGTLKAALLASLSAFVVDYCVRLKVGGTHVNHFYVKQLPIIAPSIYQSEAPWSADVSLEDWIADRVLELVYTSVDMATFADDLGYEWEPFLWEPERRSLLRAELDAAFFHLYGVSREDTDYILDTFPIVRRKEEDRYGDFRSKRLILEIYDAMQKAIDTGTTYQTIVDPPPGQGPRHLERAKETR